jgi:hypothetical protein
MAGGGESIEKLMTGGGILSPSRLISNLVLALKNLKKAVLISINL